MNEEEREPIHTLALGAPLGMSQEQATALGFAAGAATETGEELRAFYAGAECAWALANGLPMPEPLGALKVQMAPKPLRPGVTVVELPPVPTEEALAKAARFEP